HAPTPAAAARAAGAGLYVGGGGAGLSQGLGQGFVSANIPQFAGDLGITTTEASWLMAAYMIPRAALPLMLIKIRTQFGLRRFAEIGIVAYVAVAFASVWVSDLRSAVVVQFLSGAASAPLSTLAFMYMLEPLSQDGKMRLGLPAAMTALMTGPMLARVVSPALIGDGGLTWLHLVSLGLAMVSLALVFLLPLRPVPHQKVIQPLDFASFALIAFGFAGLTIGFVMGPIHFWSDAPWIGWLMAGAAAALAGAVMIELNRKAPILDIRWLVSPAMLHLTGALLLFRLILSEQSTGAPRMFAALGVAPSQMVTLFTIIVMASVLGGLACIAWMKPGREPWLHLAALILIAAGALMDSQATPDTRPHQMVLSQAMIGFAGMLFLPPAMMAGLISALRRGPQYILSFVIVFISTQSIGGVLGAGLFTTLINDRQAAHYQMLAEQLTATSATTSAAIAARMAGLAAGIADPAALKAEGLARIAQEAATQSWVMAYNDAYFLTFLVAALAACALLIHVLRDWLAVRGGAAQTDIRP
ncbi:MFS transporter, partial [Paracoccus siganidrum]|uniref:MFS transporter n=1 Tax=Paracoccus siganidrum TaxID=1276757 RepID=UPI0030B862A7